MIILPQVFLKSNDKSCISTLMKPVCCISEPSWPPFTSTSSHGARAPIIKLVSQIYLVKLFSFLYSLLHFRVFSLAYGTNWHSCIYLGILKILMKPGPCSTPIHLRPRHFSRTWIHFGMCAPSIQLKKMTEWRLPGREKKIYIHVLYYTQYMHKFQ